MRTLQFPLSRGTLNLTIDQELVPFEDIVTVAERINPKRSFIFASKIIGRYLVTSGSTMTHYANSLAGLIPAAHLEGNVTVVSLSEAALGLGYLVHASLPEECCAVNISTTRRVLDAPIRAVFKEPHSHLTDHFIYKSFDADIESRVDLTNTLILVDDEITTGNTLLNLVKSLNLPHVNRVIILTLTDWSGGNSLDFGVETHKYSFINGSYTWEENPDNPPIDLPYTPVKESIRYVHSNSIRLPNDFRLIGDPHPRLRNRPTICFYYNELLPQAIAMMDNYEYSRSEIFFVSLSSSPIVVGSGLFQSVIELPGLYNDNPVYLYNVAELLSSFTEPSYSLAIVADTFYSDHKSIQQLKEVLNHLKPDVKVKNHFNVFSNPQFILDRNDFVQVESGSGRYRKTRRPTGIIESCIF